MNREEREPQTTEQTYCYQRTPAKRQTTTAVPSSYCASSLQEIASRIKSNAEKRFRQNEENGEYFLIFWSELKQINEPSKTKSAFSYDDSLSAHAVDALIRKEKMRLCKVESLRAERYSRIQALLLVLRGAVREGKRLSGKLKSLKTANSISCLQIQYERFHRTSEEVLHLVISKLEAHTSQRQLKLAQIKNVNSEIPTLKMRKAVQLERLQVLNQALTGHQKHLLHLQRELQPTLQAMVHCMFLIGVLKEQIDITVMLKKEKRALKQNGEKAVNRSFKLSHRLARREIVVDCKNSLIAELVAPAAIYMHCKSLTISNLSTLMNTLSFFSEEFKDVYCYSTFHKYVGCYFYGNCESFAGQTEIKDPLKKKLIVRTKEEHIPLLKAVLRAFQVDIDLYCVFLQPYCMMIEARPEAPESSQPEDYLLEFNELKISFANNAA